MSATTTTCPAWCTDHVGGPDQPDDWCTTGYTRIAGATLNLSNGTHAGDTRVFGLYELGGDRGSISLDEAERVAFLLLGYVAAGRKEVQA